MPVNLKIRVSGLCAVVPMADQSMRVVLVNARDYGHDKTPIKPNTPNVDVHVPVLAVPERFATAQNRPWAFRFRNLRLSSDFLFAYLLDNDDLEISNVTAAPVAKPTAVSGCPTQGANDHYFGWIARMADLGAGTMLKAASTDQLDPALTLARLAVVAGTCETALLGLENHKANGQADVVKWIYQDHDGNIHSSYQSRALAETIAIDLTVNHASRVDFVSKKGRTITLDGAGNPIDAFLLNLSLPALLNETLPPSPRPWDHHFCHFYRLAGLTGGYAPRSLPGDVCYTTVSGLGGPRCPPSYFDSTPA